MARQPLTRGTDDIFGQNSKQHETKNSEFKIHSKKNKKTSILTCLGVLKITNDSIRVNAEKAF